VCVRCLRACDCTFIYVMYACMYIMYVCKYICMYVCMYVRYCFLLLCVTQLGDKALSHSRCFKTDLFILPSRTFLVHNLKCISMTLYYPVSCIHAVIKEAFSFTTTHFHFSDTDFS